MADEETLSCTYCCPRCKYSTNHKPSFKRHIFRGRECKALVGCDLGLDDLRVSLFPVKDKHVCTVCGKGYNTPNGLAIHCANMRHLSQQLAQKTRAMEQTINGNVLNGNVNGNVNNGTVNNNIYIQMPRNFGEENTEHITKEFLSEMAKSVMSGIPELMRNIHFHPEHPENRNVRLACKRDKTIEKVKDGKWVKSTHHQVEKAMFDSGCRMVMGLMMEPAFMEKYENILNVMMDDYIKTASNPRGRDATEVRSRLYVMILDESGKIQFLEEDNTVDETEAVVSA